MLGIRFVPAVTMIGVLAIACSAGGAGQPPLDAGMLAIGTWGGDSAGLIVRDTTTHVHIGCTSGDVPRRIAVDANGRFDVAGSYHLRTHPVVVGPTVPARYTGRLVGDAVILTITVNDTVEKKTVVLGPVHVTYGRPPRHIPCPICRDVQVHRQLELESGDTTARRSLGERPTPAVPALPLATRHHATHLGA